MVKNPFACVDCHLILPDGEDQCSRCPSAQVSSQWQGYVVVIDPSRSEIAQRLQIERPGSYALKVINR